MRFFIQIQPFGYVHALSTEVEMSRPLTSHMISMLIWSTVWCVCVKHELQFAGNVSCCFQAWTIFLVRNCVLGEMDFNNM